MLACRSFWGICYGVSYFFRFCFFPVEGNLHSAIWPSP
jgi:hypothetical protein